MPFILVRKFDSVVRVTVSQATRILLFVCSFKALKEMCLLSLTAPKKITRNTLFGLLHE